MTKHYEAARDRFLESLGDDLTATEQARAIEAWDKTVEAASARFTDAWFEFGNAVMEAAPAFDRLRAAIEALPDQVKVALRDRGGRDDG